ncbi:DUF1654 domain-containing protein [Azotobacter salinestris]|uniref:DUF1654 domain-containing protein n=1 Tax=Azotobacter salinestris TaxID=69964 RepID=UPI001266AA08|nr:DUF1654 domain-containing protein [Azotobacter salinestris]
MARKALPRTPTPYELLALRIKKQILSPRAQASRCVLVSRLPEEPLDAWEQLLEDLADEESVTMAKREDGAVHLTWTAPTSD